MRIDRVPASPRPLLALPRVDVEHHGDDHEQQQLHENKEAGNEVVVVVMGVEIDDDGTDKDAGRKPNELSFSVPRHS